MNHLETNAFSLCGFDFKLIIDKEDDHCFCIALIAARGEQKWLVDETTRPTLIEAQQVWQKLSVARLMVWVNDQGANIDVLG